MVKTPKMRHSKARREPVTIDLAATRLPGDDVTAPAAAQQQADLEAAAASDVARETSQSTAAEAEIRATSTERDVPPTATSAEAPTFGRQQPTDGDTRPSTAHTAEKSETTAAPRPAAPARSGISVLAAGLVGGVITLLGAGALQYGGLLPSPGAADGSALEAVRSEVAALKSELAGVASGGAAGETVAALEVKFDALAGDVATLQAAVQSGGAGEGAGLAALDAKIAEMQARLAELAQNTGASADLAPINEKLTALDTAIRDATGAVAAGDGRLKALEQQLSQLASKVDGQANQPKIALSIAASALKAAIDRGQPFTAELETLAAISPNLPQLTALRAHAETGVATRDDILAEVDSAANAMIAAGKPADPNAGVLDQLWQSAASLVTVRPVGAVAGEGVPETAARLEAALKAGDLGAALTEYDSLPDAAKAASRDFAAKLRARLDVETLVDQAIAEAMKTV